MLMKFKMSKFSVQKLDRKNKQFAFGIKEDLDCSGLPPDGETKCDFDEGMISGLLSGFYGGEFFTRETGCWGTGDRSCFFKSVPLEK